MNLRDRLRWDERILRSIRSFFSERGHVEVDTPCLAPFLIPEPSIEVFRTTFHPTGGGSVQLFLAPSPELWMKRLLAGGSGSIFQVAHAFRDADFGGRLHNPEFRLLEWYTVGAGYQDQVPVTEELVARLAAECGGPGAPERLATPFRRMTMEQAFAEIAGIDLARCVDEGAMIAAARGGGLEVRDDATGEQAFHLVYLSLVEPGLPRDRPLVITDWPALVPTTARQRPGTSCSERWELLIEGVEIANCYTEETDPAAVSRFLAGETRRKRGCRTVHPTDEGFARLFGEGFPPCAGVALGVDRLAMILAGEHSLEGVIRFPLSAILPAHSTADSKGAP